MLTDENIYAPIHEEDRARVWTRVALAVAAE
jgi:hypothetical protein